MTRAAPPSTRPIAQGEDVGERLDQVGFVVGHPSRQERRPAVQDFGEPTCRLGAQGACWTPQARIAGGLLHLGHNRRFAPDPAAERKALAVVKNALLAHRSRRLHVS
ncbi:hypothetical protein EH183_26790 [Streptomyces sp. CB01881]|nr:hypothetical protein C2142_26810 [Streptomyces sp. CB01881]TYC71360.1 hypothetical protein EH183_26790 [Streptomyces sp. CB01881]